MGAFLGPPLVVWEIRRMGGGGDFLISHVESEELCCSSGFGTWNRFLEVQYCSVQFFLGKTVRGRGKRLYSKRRGTINKHGVLASTLHFFWGFPVAGKSSQRMLDLGILGGRKIRGCVVFQFRSYSGE